MTQSVEAGAVEASDGAAVRRVLAGDVDAYRILVERYRVQFGRYAIAMLGDSDSAADAVQEAFIRAFDSLETCREPERFGAWFFRILTNQCHTARGRKRDRVDIAQVDVAGKDRADDLLEREELGDRLADALGRLTPEQREAFVLKHVDGRSYEEIAELVGTGVDALKMRVHRARDALRKMMGERP